MLERTVTDTVWVLRQGDAGGRMTVSVLTVH